ncbi:acyl-CoA reductase [Methylacidiphilum caldifontis]|uniref:Acyl-CoA reductase n=1 Tax=Methylacidiphilum caldifontis TaxID=2795386 RepID=A0A4Y8PE59_9BACT|nr:acyl-CoA reductase [Methylacidiphilum caldifontis]TFE69611.1 acyl-CoA reductase [Methylacidiphilum caldifontis]
MHTLERIELLDEVCKLFPETGFKGKEDLAALLELELKSLTALDEFFSYGYGKTKAIAPSQIYHVLAANTPIAGYQSLLLGLLLGSFNAVQCPKPVKNSLFRFVSSLPQKLQHKVELYDEFNINAFENSDCIVVFGQQKTIEYFKNLTPTHKRFIGHGHKVSLIWAGRVEEVNREKMALISRDISLYSQLGCLSPQSILIEENSSSEKIESFCQVLADSLRQDMSIQSQSLDIDELAAIKQHRDCAKALGWALWESSLLEPNPWTVILRKSPIFEPTCGYRTIYVDLIEKSKLEDWLKPIKGMISTVGVFEKMPENIISIFIESATSRFCPIGSMQQPAAFWHHDGRTRLQEMVRWVDWE